MTLIATIHSPSAQVFNYFDKVMVLAPGGIKVYYDSPKHVKHFFHHFGIELTKYKNPADELLKFANNPENLNRLKEVQPESLTLDEPFSEYSLNKRLVENPINRRANFFQQLFYLGRRNLEFAFRNPHNFAALFFISFF